MGELRLVVGDRLNQNVAARPSAANYFLDRLEVEQLVVFSLGEGVSDPAVRGDRGEVEQGLGNICDWETAVPHAIEVASRVDPDRRGSAAPK
jgi:hypothetical protein